MDAIDSHGANPPAPLSGIVVLDVSRMLPGAVLARMLVDLGARLIKVEQPGRGDPLRVMPPLVDGIGAGFCSLFRGAESIALDLKQPAGAASLRRLAQRVDVLVESFRPGTLEGWGIGHRTLRANHPALVWCSLSGFGPQGPQAGMAAHDLNFVAQSGLLSLLPGGGVPRIQIADVATGLLACSSLLAALLQRTRNGRGTRIHQPLALGPLPFLTWAMADVVAGGAGPAEVLLSGRCPAYRLYECGDGEQLAVGALEPKFWREIVTLLELPQFAAEGLDGGPRGQEVARRVEARLASRPRDEWLELFGERGLPVTAVHDLETAAQDPLVKACGLLEPQDAPGGRKLPWPASWLPSSASARRRPAPRLGEHTEAILSEFGAATDG